MNFLILIAALQSPLLLMDGQLFYEEGYIWACLPPLDGSMYCYKFHESQFCETVMNNEGKLECLKSI